MKVLGVWDDMRVGSPDIDSDAAAVKMSNWPLELNKDCICYIMPAGGDQWLCLNVFIHDSCFFI